MALPEGGRRQGVIRQVHPFPDPYTAAFIASVSQVEEAPRVGETIKAEGSTCRGTPVPAFVRQTLAK